MVRPNMRIWWLPLAALPALAATTPAPPPDGAALYNQRCAACHDRPDAASRAPARAVLATRTPEAIVDTLDKGLMAAMASGLSREEVDAIATYLTGKAPVRTAPVPADADAAARCKASPPPTLAGPRWNGWSPTLDNARYQPGPALKAGDVPRLKVKWAFEFPGGVGSQPVVAGGRVYFGAGGGRVYALDAATGCMHWRAEVKGGVRAAVSVGPLAGPGGGRGPARLAVFVGDRSGGVHALDAATGNEVWATRVETHPFATITGAPALYRGRLYVPVSSSEEISTFVKDYHCCTFRGSVAALDAATGKQLWRTYTIADPAKPFRTDPNGGQMFGPAGAAIWSAPTIDPRRGVLYVATGDSYTDAPTTNSDAVLAMDLVTGALRWARQITADDNYLVGCTGKPGQPIACPLAVGPDHDFGASPVLRSLPGGRAILLAGQKSGEVTALDPDRQGAVRWRAKVGQGGPLGGIEWGMAADASRLFVPIADPFAPKAEARRGMHALAIADGRALWSSLAPDPDCKVAPKGSLVNVCTAGLSAAATAIDGVVIAGSMDGMLRGYAARDGGVVWQVDLGRASFQPLNAEKPRKGDTINAGGATVAGGTLFQVSGYQPSGPRAANLLLAFTVDGK